MGQQLLYYKGDELGSVMTTTNRHLQFLDTPAVFENTQTSSFNPADLCKGKSDLWLVLPPEHLRAQSPLLRVWIGSALRAVVKNGLQEQNKVYFELDEAASIGHLAALDDAVDKYRGYGVRWCFITKAFPNLRNAGRKTRIKIACQYYAGFFGVNDMAISAIHQ